MIRLIFGGNFVPYKNQILISNFNFTVKFQSVILYLRHFKMKTQIKISAQSSSSKKNLSLKKTMYIAALVGREKFEEDICVKICEIQI